MWGWNMNEEIDIEKIIEKREEYNRKKQEIEERYKLKSERVLKNNNRAIAFFCAIPIIGIIGGGIIDYKNENSFDEIKRDYREVCKTLNALENCDNRDTSLIYMLEEIRAYLPNVSNGNRDKAIEKVRGRKSIIENSSEFKNYEERKGLAEKIMGGTFVGGVVGALAVGLFGNKKERKINKKREEELSDLNKEYIKS